MGNDNPRTLSEFETQFINFREEAVQLTTEVEGKRPRWPGFRLTHDIKHSLVVCAEMSENPDQLELAFIELERIRGHFKSKQAAYVRGILRQELIKNHDELVAAKYFPGYLTPLTQAIRQFGEMLSAPFDLETISQEYWKIVDLFASVRKDQKKRWEKEQAAAQARLKEAAEKRAAVQEARKAKEQAALQEVHTNTAKKLAELAKTM